MKRRIHGLALGAALLAAVTLAAPVAAVPAPDSAQRATLQRRIGRLGRVQIVGPSGQTLLLKPVVRDDGLHMRELYRAPRQALIEIGEVPLPPPPVPFVPWSEITAIRAPARGFASGAMMGAIFATGVTAATLFAFRHELSHDWDVYEPAVWFGAPLVIGAGVLAGGLLFGLVGEEWRTVYPARTARR
jgi:hypothetical protein